MASYRFTKAASITQGVNTALIKLSLVGKRQVPPSTWPSLVQQGLIYARQNYLLTQSGATANL